MRRIPRAGFTLIEMMVSMSIGTVVLLLAVAALKSSADGYDRNIGSVGAEREARAVLTQLSEDLSKAVRGGELKLVAGGDGWRRDRLGFLCLQPPDAQAESERIGDLCAVVYYVKDLQIGRDTVRCLMRGFRGSSETFAALRSEMGSSLQQGEESDEPVAFGVIGFEVDPLERDQAGRWKLWVGEDPLAVEARAPQALRVRLVVARRELVGKLRDPDAWDRSPLIGKPEGAENSKLLEVYEVIQAYGHGS